MMVEYLASIGHRRIGYAGGAASLLRTLGSEDICRLCMTFPSIQILSSFKPVKFWTRGRLPGDGPSPEAQTASNGSCGLRRFSCLRCDAAAPEGRGCAFRWI